MSPLFRAPRRAAATLLTVAVASLTALHAGSAAAAPSPAAAPTAKAPAAPSPQAASGPERLQPGNAAMGWRHRSTVGAGKLADSSAAAKKPFVPSGVLGIDVSSWQKTVNWRAQAAAGKRFAYVKATEGRRYKNPYFASQYNGAAQAGLLRGAYHFAAPASSSGRTQARVFVANGGGWTADGATLPGVLDIEYNPYGRTCYGLSKKAMVRWIRSFTTEYQRLTTRDAVIYTTTDWWTRCTGNTKAFSTTNPLWLARYATAPGKLPGGWRWTTFWQYSNRPIDQNRFSASYQRLRVLATNAR